MKIEVTPVWFLAAAGVGVAALWVWSRGGLRGAGESLGAAVVDTAGGIATGIVTGIGETVGIPKTSMTACQKAIADGRTWDASFACPAPDFIRYVLKGNQ